jgi:hypothetical protein
MESKGVKRTREEEKEPQMQFSVNVANTVGNGYFGVVRGKTTGIFDKWSDCQASILRFPCAIWKKFTKFDEAMQWLNKCFSAPTFDQPNALLVKHFATYSCDQDHDWHTYYRIAFIGFFEQQTEENSNKYRGTFQIQLKTFIRLLRLAPQDRPLCVSTNSQCIINGLYYGMRNYPKKDFLPSTNKYWVKIDNLIAQRKFPVSVEYNENKN